MLSYIDKQVILWYIRGHETRAKEYTLERQRIMLGDGTTEQKAITLEELERSPLAVKVNDVNDALADIGDDIAAVYIRSQLQSGIMLNICERRQFPYERLFIPGISRKAFYRYRNEFIEEVAAKIGHGATY